MSQPADNAPPPDENPFQSPSNATIREPPNNPEWRRRRRNQLTLLGVLFVPIAAFIGGFVTCVVVAPPAELLLRPRGYDYEVAIGIGWVSFLVGAIVGGVAASKILKKWNNP